MIERYQTPDMKRIWSDQNKYETWLKVELAVTEVLVEDGIVHLDSFELIKYKADIMSTDKNGNTPFHIACYNDCNNEDVYRPPEAEKFEPNYEINDIYDIFIEPVSYTHLTLPTSDLV